LRQRRPSGSGDAAARLAINGTCCSDRPPCERSGTSSPERSWRLRLLPRSVHLQQEHRRREDDDHQQPAAAVELEASLRINPSYSKSHNNLGIALASLGRVDEAITHFRSALALNPKDEGAFFNLGRALLEKGSREEAVRAFREAVRLNPDFVVARKALRALDGAP